MTAAGQPFDQGQHQLGLGDPQRGGRLVHDDQLGVLHDRLGHRDRLPLPAGQRADRLPDRPHGRDPQVLQRLLGGQLHVDLIEQPEPRHLVAEQHVLHDVQVVGQREVLVDGRDPEVGRVPAASAGAPACPARAAAPVVGCQMPAMHLISVLLPAPLSPTRAVTCPAGMSRSMPVSACTGPKFLPMPSQPQQRRVTVTRRAGLGRSGAGWHPARVRGPGAILGAVRYHLGAPACSTTYVIVTQRYRTSSSPRRTSPRTAGTLARSRP